MVDQVAAAATAERYEPSIARLSHDLVRLGVVAVHDPGALSLQEGLGSGSRPTARSTSADELPIRVHASIRSEQLAAADRGRSCAAATRSGRPAAGPGSAG